MFGKIRNKLLGFRLSMQAKLNISLSLIAAVLLVSSAITILEYRRMSSYLSDLIAADIRSINVAQKLTSVVDNYNLRILTVIGDDSVSSLPDFDQEKFVFYCDSLKSAMTEQKIVPLADSVLYSYSAYMLTSLELTDVLQSDFINTREWYFERLQPVFWRLRHDIDNLSDAIYMDLQYNSANFDEGFERSIIPGAVAVAMGIILVLLLMFYITVYYVAPLKKMLSGLDDYLNFARKYNFTFEGDDELSRLNEEITALTEENRLLRLRIKKMKESAEDES